MSLTSPSALGIATGTAHYVIGVGLVALSLFADSMGGGLAGKRGESHPVPFVVRCILIACGATILAGELWGARG